MHRKKFLSSFLAAGSLPAFLRANEPVESPPPLIPPYLKKGSVIGITCPAGYITEEEIRPAVLQMMEWGFYIKTGDR